MQRALLAGGALLIAVGREVDVDAVTAIGGSAVVVALVLLAASLVEIRAGATNERFDAAIDAYVLAIALGLAGTPLGIAIAMAFTSVPFVVRTVQPVIEDLGKEIEEAGRSLGASDPQILWKLIFPAIFPAFLAGCSLAFASNTSAS